MSDWRLAVDIGGTFTDLVLLDAASGNVVVEKTLTTAQFPGTAVFWEEQYFEVVEAYSLPQGGLEYVLEPWREHHVMRVVEPYDAASEAKRLADHRAHLNREKHRKTANLLALFPNWDGQVAFRFTASGGTVNVDDVWIDPYER